MGGGYIDCIGHLVVVVPSMYTVYGCVVYCTNGLLIEFAEHAPLSVILIQKCNCVSHIVSFTLCGCVCVEGSVFMGVSLYNYTKYFYS